MDRATIREESDLLTKSESFEVFFRRYYPYAVRLVMRHIPNQSSAEDITQEIFIRLYHKDRTEIESIKAWLAKAAINGVYNYLRTEERHQARIEKEKERLPRVFSTIESEWMREEDVRAVRRALTQLDEKERKLLLLRYEGFDYGEIAQAIQVKKASIGSQLVRAREKFQRIYLKMAREENG
ncbi:RNA polymerase sigma factor, sigma-70 family [Marininema mesophilum]|uniref:RNA polymerase sigma factor, sigma-70 family n=1 Tax=Marininema mesophilum TaxID=1048340 RepID=A0A1H2WIE7_9BACL|nr:sigma-70 family RNA polymerase sigma factor [Marininema mesophilum]SDW80325.1 RNA polymerase sigma factor, sigma-70 family [Marininema mesophilum]